jgi:hypothetical protein
VVALHILNIENATEDDETKGDDAQEAQVHSP